MLGERLLVAPIFNERGTVKYYVPEGRWTNLLTGDVVVGGKWHDEEHSYMTLPLLVRPNSLIAIGKDNQRPDYDFADNVTLHLYELEDGASASAVVHDMKGAAELRVAASRNGNVIELTAEGAGKPWTIVLRGIESAASVDGGSAVSTAEGVEVTPAAGASRMTIKL